MVQYHIPNILTHLLLYSKPNNSNYDILAAEHTAWIDACGSASDAHKMAWKRAEISLLTCRAFPTSSLGPLRTCIEYLTSAFLLDQLTDAPTTAVEAKKWADIYKQAFRQTLGEAEGPAAIINHLANRMVNAIEDPYWLSLVRNNILLADSMAKEAVDRENPDPEITLEEYMKVRRDTIGARQLFDLGRWMHKLDISNDVLTHPDIVNIENQFVDLVSLANDLYSYRKECFECDPSHNYITIAFRDPVTNLRENDLQGAIDYTCRKFCQVLKDMEHQKKTLPSFGESVDAQVAEYIEMVTDVVVGTIQWSLECGRYGHVGTCGTVKAPVWGDVVFNMDFF